MKFMYFFYPALAATLEERKRIRPIARHTEPWQKMFAEVADSREEAVRIGNEGLIGVGWRHCFHFFGFTEAFRLPEDEVTYPNKQPLPASECTMERLEKAHFALVGTTADIRREMDLLVETANPEWFIRQSDQGYAPLDHVKQMLKRFGKEILPYYA